MTAAAVRGGILIILVATVHAGDINLGLLFRFTDSSGNDLGDAWRGIAATALIAAEAFNARDTSLIPEFGNLGTCSHQLVPQISSTPNRIENTASDPVLHLASPAVHY